MNSEFGLKRFVASHRSWEVTQGHRVTSHLTRLPLRAGPGVVGRKIYLFRDSSGNPGRLQTVGLNPLLDPEKPKSSFLRHHSLIEGRCRNNVSPRIVDPAMTPERVMVFDPGTMQRWGHGVFEFCAPVLVTVYICDAFASTTAKPHHCSDVVTDAFLCVPAPLNPFLLDERKDKVNISRTLMKLKGCTLANSLRSDRAEKRRAKFEFCRVLEQALAAGLQNESQCGTALSYRQRWPQNLKPTLLMAPSDHLMGTNCNGILDGARTARRG
jgi:hypothetical protein